jgi:hypothetical protein
MTWVRSGFCIRCGECCYGDPFLSDAADPRISPAMREPPQRMGWCPLLRFHEGDPKGNTTCIGHIGEVPAGQEDPYYMSGCNVWPDHPDQIRDYPSCTYTFEWVDLPPITGSLTVSDPGDELA